MLRYFKWILVLALILVICVVFWVGFALWTGIYSVYSYPPSKQHPEGVTLLISRDEKEPMFNSPDYVAPKEKPAESSGGMSFQSIPKAKRDPEARTIAKLPYIEWAYQKSLERPIDQ